MGGNRQLLEPSRGINGAKGRTSFRPFWRTRQAAARGCRSTSPASAQIRRGNRSPGAGLLEQVARGRAMERRYATLDTEGVPGTNTDRISTLRRFAFGFANRGAAPSDLCRRTPAPTGQSQGGETVRRNAVAIWPPTRALFTSSATFARRASPSVSSVTRASTNGVSALP